MRLLPLLVLTQALSFSAFAQELATAPSPVTPPRADRPARPPSSASPEIHSDGRVTFRLMAPQAKEVIVSGQAIEKTTLTKGDAGLWSATVGPVEPGIWEYSLGVDGVQMIDPGNPLSKPQRSPRTSILHIPSNPLQPWDYQQVPHGTLHHHQYSSKTLDQMREFFVYTPPGYERDTATKLPVLYLIHGFSDNHASWSGHGKAHWILDSLLAEGKVAPMVVVMPDGHPIAPGSGSREAYWKSNTQAFERELIEEMLPMVEGLYRVRTDAASRAIAGLSMGGGHSLFTGLRHLDRFAWVGAFSAGVPEMDQVSDRLADAESVNEKLKLLWVACGKKDFLFQRNRDFVAQLTEKGIRHQWVETEGDHSWPVWRRYLADFAPLLFQAARQ